MRNLDELQDRLLLVGQYLLWQASRVGATSAARLARALCGGGRAPAARPAAPLLARRARAA